MELGNTHTSEIIPADCRSALLPGFFDSLWSNAFAKLMYVVHLHEPQTLSLMEHCTDRPLNLKLWPMALVSLTLACSAEGGRYCGKGLWQWMDARRLKLQLRRGSGLGAKNANGAHFASSGLRFFDL